MLRALQIKWWLFRGKREKARKHFADATAYFEKVLAVDPLRVIALAYIGSCLCDLRRYPEVIDAFELALQKAPHYSEMHAFLAQAYTNLNRHREAYESIHRAFRLQPNLKKKLQWLYVLGYCSGHTGRWDEAAETFDRMTSLDSRHSNAWQGLGWAYLNLSRNLDALTATRLLLTSERLSSCQIIQ